MVAIFTGLGAGFERGSAAKLGARGLLGSGLQGRGGEGVSVNAATGNLILSRQDEFLIGKGQDASVLRTYNSLGALDDNGDYWRQSTDRRVYGLTGTVSTSGSTVKRVSADGAEITYTWNTTGSYYETTDGAGAYDRLTYNGTLWTWADGDTAISETYALASTGVWRIASQVDGDGNALTFTYVSGSPDKLEKVTTQDGGYIKYTWTGSNITRVESWINSTTSYSNTVYGYDGSNRLTSVTVDLTPSNSGDSVTYVTTYTYDGASNRVASITQTDGSVLAITYYTSGTYTGWVKDLTQTVASGDTRVTAFAYTDEGAGLTRTEVTDPRGQVTKLWWKNADTGGTATDERGQLMRVMAPPAVTGGTPTEINYTYDANGNVLTAVTKSGATTLSTVSYQYDAAGNVSQITDANGNVVTRQYAATTNKLLLETRTGSHTGGSGSLYTRYVYDAEEHLTFVISAEGHVTEYAYTAGGEVQYVFEYPGDAYTIGSTLPTHAQMASWRSALNRTTSKILSNDYDARGNLTATSRYGASDASGSALTSEGTSSVYFSYDAGGRLLSKYNSAGSSGVAETYAYDGLGRVIVSTDAAGGRTTVVFNDAATATTVTTQTASNGTETGQSYIVVSTYNKAGELISVVDSGSATNSSFTAGGTTTSLYDKNGQLRLTTDPTGLRHFYLYDKAGQKIADIYADNSGSATGEIVEYRYDVSGRLAATARYTNRLTNAQLTTLADPVNEVEISTIRPTAHGYDIWQWNVYDTGGRVIETILGDGSVTGYEYDASDRMVKTTGYYNKLAAGTITGYMTTSPATVAWPAAHANDTVTRTFYDRDGRVVGALSAEGYLSKIVYDEAGQKIQEIAYANATTTTYRASGTYDQLLSTVTLDTARDVSIRYVYDGQGLLRYTIDGINRVTERVYFTATTSMAVGLARKTVAYGTALGSVANYTYATIKSAVSALASVQNDRATWSVYNDRGQLKYAISQIRSDNVSGVYHPIGTVTRYDYDAAGLVIKATQYATTIDMFGVTVDTPASIDTWAASNSANARITRNYYAERGELRFTVDAEGYVNQYAYWTNGLVRYNYRYSAAIAVDDTSTISTVSTANKGTSVFTEKRYDSAGREVETWDANGVRHYYGYYANGTRAWTIRASGGMDESRTEYRYDQAGRLLREIDHVSELTSGSNVGASAVQVNGAQRLQSASTAYNAVVTREGELRLYHSGEVIWSNGVREVVSGATYRLVAQTDGNLVVYRDVSGQSAVAIWSTATSYSGATYLIMQDTGNFELRKGTVGADLGLVWSSGTTGAAGSTYATVYASTQYTYDGLGNVLTVIDQKSQTTTNTYDKAGRLLTTSKGGVTSSYQYDAFGHGVKVTDALGNASYSYYDQAGRVVLTVDAESYAVRTDYNAFGEIATLKRYANKATATGSLATQPTITDNSGADAVTTFTYDKLGRLLSTTDAVGGVESRTYDTFGQVATTTNKLGGVTTNTYDKLGRLVQEQLPVASHNADGSQQAANVINKYVYDSRGNRTQMTAAFGLTEVRITNYEYDAANRLVRTYHDALSVTTSAGTTSTIAPEERWIYDRRGNVIEAIDANGARTLSWYDRLDRVTHQLSALGVLTRYFYDLNGNVAETRVYETAVTLPADAKGLAPAGTGAYRVTRYAYDALNRRTETRIPAIDVAAISGGTLSITTQDLVTTTVYDGASNVVKVIDAAGKATWFYYDKMGNQTAVVDAENFRIDRTFDADGNVLTEKRYYNASATPTATTAPPTAPTAHARDQVTTFVYDKAGRRTLAVDGEGYAVATGYNGLGEILTVTRYASPVTWSGSVPVVVTGAGDAVTTMTYDIGGRLTNSADALSVGESYKLNAFGEQVRVTNRLTGVTTYAYDKLGRMITETLPVGAYNSSGTLVSANVINSYAYDAAGNRTRMVEASGLAEARTTNYEYDLAGQLLRTYGVSTAVYTSSTAASSTSVTPESRSLYNRYGEVIETVDAGGGRALYWYNKAGQLTHQLGATGTLTQFFYDKNGNTLETRTYETQLTLPANANGAPPTGTGAYRVMRYTYDGLNRATETRIPSIETAVYSGGTLTVATADLVTTTVYDAVGNVVKTIDANGKTTWVYYDRAGHQTVKIDAENYRTDWTYDADGNVLSERRYATASATPSSTSAPPTAPSTTSDDRVTTFTYDKLGRRLTEVRASVKIHNGSGGETTQNSTITYTYNGLGQVLTKTEGTGDAVTYTYDTSGRLITEARAAFTDVNGATVTPTVDYYYNGLNDLARTRQRGTTGTIAAAERVTTYSYGTGGRLAAMTDAGGFTHTYRYDAAGRVVRDEYTRAVTAGTTATEAVGTDYDVAGRTVTSGVMTWTGSVWTRYSLDYVSTQYNAFGEVSARGLNGVLAEIFAFDGAGRMWRTTSGDGTWKYFMYDKAGNQTLAIASDGTDISNQTLTWALDRWGATRSAIATTFVDGVNATITRYDGRNMAIEVLEPQRELNATTRQNLTITRAYNAFGETKYEINALGAQIDYTYNTMGRQIKIESPTVAVTSEAGATSNVRPTEYRYYDLAGRLVASKDANGNLTKLTLLAGTGFGGSEALVTQTQTADNATVVTGYDIHGDARRITDQISRVTNQTFDAMGRVTQVSRPGGLVETFEYDGLGQTLRRYNNLLGSSYAETTTYDGQGRITQQVAAGGDTTSYTYTWSGSLATTGLGTFGGWTQVTTYANTKTLTEQTDQFGRAVSKTDLGGNTSASSYDKAGRVVLQNGGVDLNLTYFNTGRLATSWSLEGVTTSDDWLLRTQTNGYDAVGNLVSQRYELDGEDAYYNAEYWVWVGQGPKPALPPFMDPENPEYGWEYHPAESGVSIIDSVLQNATATYDALGRLTAWNETGAAVPAASTTYKYDAQGNIRQTSSSFYELNAFGTPGSSPVTRDNWYRFDALNRVVTSEGVFQGTLGSGSIVRGSQGMDIYYDNAGQRSYSLRTDASSVITREDYTYDSDGRLTQVRSGNSASSQGVIVGRYGYDLLGRLSWQKDYTGSGYQGSESGTNLVYHRTNTWNEKSQITTDVAITKRGSDTYQATSTYGYGSGTTYALGSPLTITTQNWKNGSGQATSETTNTYAWRDGPVTSSVLYKLDVSQGTTQATPYAYETIGGRAHLVTVTIPSVPGLATQTVRYTNDLTGQALSRWNGNGGGAPKEYFYRFGGKEMGHITNNGTQETSYNVSIADRTAVQPTSPGLFHNGATSGTAYGAFAEGVDPVTTYDQGSSASSYTARAGETLQGIAANLWGDSSLWYKLAEANGLGAQSELIGGQQLRIPPGVMRSTHNASTFKPYDPMQALGELGPASPKPQNRKNCGVMGAILVAMIAVVVVAALQPHLAAFFSGGQGGLLTATGVVGEGALATGAAAGTLAGTSATAAAVTGANIAAGYVTVGGVAGFAGGAVAGAAASAVSQFAGMAMGMQDKFSWNAVALAGISGGIGGTGSKLGIGGKGTWSVGARGMLSSALSQGIGDAIGIGDFSWTSVAGAGVGAALGRYVAGIAPGGVGVDKQGAAFDKPSLLNVTMSGGASAIGNAAMRSLIDGTDFGDNVVAALPDVIGNVIGQMVTGQVRMEGDKQQFEAANANALGPERSDAAGGVGGIVGELRGALVSGARGLYDEVANGLNGLKEGLQNLADNLPDFLSLAGEVGLEAVAAGVELKREYARQKIDMEVQYAEEFGIPVEHYSVKLRAEGTNYTGFLGTPGATKRNDLKFDHSTGEQDQLYGMLLTPMEPGPSSQGREFGYILRGFVDKEVPTIFLTDYLHGEVELTGERQEIPQFGIVATWESDPFSDKKISDALSSSLVNATIEQTIDATPWVGAVVPFAKSLLDPVGYPIEDAARDAAINFTGGKILQKAGDLVGDFFRLFQRQCFAAGTLVHTRDGLKPIELVQIGDMVWSRSEHDIGEAGWRQVVESGCTGEKEIYEVAVCTPSGAVELYRTTELHPFWSEGGLGRGAFIAAGDLNVGDKLRLADGSAAFVTAVVATGIVEPVYNFTVEGWHTYYVGELNVWVHNECFAAAMRRLLREGHSVRRHGEGVTDDMLRWRAKTGQTPDGTSPTRRGGPRNGQAAIPELSSAFYSNELLVEAEATLRKSYLNDAIAERLMRNPNARDVELTGIDLGKSLGRGFERQTLAKIDGLTKVDALFKFQNGKWVTETIYPSR